MRSDIASAPIWKKQLARNRATLVVREREVDLAVGAQLLLEVVGEHAEHEVLDVVLVELRLARDRDQLPVDPHQRRAERGEQQVAAARAPTARRGSARSAAMVTPPIAHAWTLRLTPLAREVGRPAGRPTITHHRLCGQDQVQPRVGDQPDAAGVVDAVVGRNRFSSVPTPPAPRRAVVFNSAVAAAPPASAAVGYAPVCALYASSAC